MEGPRDLVGARDTTVSDLTGGRARDVSPAECDMTLVGNVVTSDDVDEGRFAGSIRPHQPNDLAFFHAYREIGDGLYTAKILADLVAIEHVRWPPVTD